MNIILDTHIFLWYITGSTSLTDNQASMIRDWNNDVYLSVASVWEIIVKNQLGKLPLPEPPEEFIPKQRLLHQISSLSLEEGSVAQLAQLQSIHKDPFDRIIICQAIHKDLTILTVDSIFRLYPVKIIS
ncbi:MAG: type II toxin-antitoxin system VapC family toxin [Synechococcaceae cyanobacterium SM2_3_1]|nr:type II toxin-antitoxin system VapC family toxin [Synechococcaceae cyanobacterium SM2_3_1]